MLQLHKHFIQVSKIAPQIQPDTVSETPTPASADVPAQKRNVESTKHMALNEMKGRKRKRAMFEEDHSLTHDNDQIMDNTLHTPVPNIHPSHRRPQNNNSEDPTQNNKTGKGKKRRKKNKQQQQQKQKQNQSSNQAVTTDTTHDNSPQQRQRDNNRPNHKQQQQQQSNAVSAQQRLERKRNYEERIKRKAFRNNETNQQEQQSQPGGKRKRYNENNSEDNVRAFDYSAVDFGQFQGGAGSAHRPKDVRSNFKSRVSIIWYHYIIM